MTCEVMRDESIWCNELGLGMTGLDGFARIEEGTVRYYTGPECSLGVESTLKEIGELFCKSEIDARYVSVVIEARESGPAVASFTLGVKVYHGRKSGCPPTAVEYRRESMEMSLVACAGILEEEWVEERTSQAPGFFLRHLREGLKRQPGHVVALLPTVADTARG